MHVFEKKLAQALLPYRSLLDTPILIAVSGGVDSMALMHALGKMVPLARLRGAHFQHGLRRSAERDALFVLQECRRRGIPIIIGRHRPQKFTEEALRDARHGFLESEQRRLGCGSIWTAHHLQDQLETFLMRVVRGSGLKGLAGIPVRRGVWFRPLLAFSKAEIRDYLKDQSVAFVEDETNASLLYTRNLIRHTVLPQLEAVANLHGGEAAFYRRLNGMFVELQGIASEQQIESDTLFSQLVTESAYFCRVPSAVWSTLSLRNKSLLSRSILENLQVVVPSRLRLEELIGAIDACQARFHVEGEVEISRSSGFLYFQTKEQLGRPGPRFFQNARKIESPELELELELDELLAVTARTLRPGDRFGRTKLKKTLHALGIPRPERRLWPLLVDEKRGVIWHAAQTSPGVRLRRLGFPFAVGAARQDTA
ncbi:MAG: tRNA lysidine(34) synthetase TilS [Bdellovibrionales bacterium]|nr:tRNA lysidine(34) synthetase TilS [Bdellovibrionales bacterium]